MKFSLSKIIAASFIISTIALFIMSFTMFPDGFVGTTRKGGVNLGCVCHGDTAASIVSVVITGPDSVAVGLSAIYTLSISNGPAIAGGFNLASQFGTLDTIPGNGTKRDSATGELTHRWPKLFTANTVSWTFKYTAPNTPQRDTLFATGNSTNNNNKSDSDKWNWSLNKNVRVYNPIGIINISSIADGFSLSQNYPNPFNPMTNVKFQIQNAAFVKLIVFDVLGREVAALVNEQLKAGIYEVDWDAGNFASGIYYYKLVVNTPRPDKSGHPSQEGNYTDTKKMVLIK